VMAHW